MIPNNRLINKYILEFEGISKRFDDLHSIELGDTKKKVINHCKLLQSIIGGLTNLKGDVTGILYNEKLDSNDKINATRLIISILSYKSSASSELRLSELILTQKFAKAGRNRDYLIFGISIILGFFLSSYFSPILNNLLRPNNSNIQLLDNSNQILLNQSNYKDELDKKIKSICDELNLIEEINWKQSNKIDSLINN